jgi:hypothetical protein
MLRCDEVTRLYASDDLGRSSLQRRLSARLHLVMCDFCRRYVRELVAIGDAARAVARARPADSAWVETMVRHALSRLHADG